MQCQAMRAGFVVKIPKTLQTLLCIASSRQQHPDATSLLVQRLEVGVGSRESGGHDLDLRVQQRALDPLRGDGLHA